MTNLDNIIILIFLLITVIVGLWAGRSKTPFEFAVAGQDFMTITLVMTIFATWMDGEVILNKATMGFEHGIAFLFFGCLGGCISLFLSGVIATRIGRFKKAISAGDILYDLYGNNAKIISGISGFLMSSTFVATQFKALSIILEYFYGLDSSIGVWISAIILIGYSLLGGIKAVTWTDVVQFFVLINTIPLVASVAVNKAGGIFHIIQSLPPEKLTFDLPKSTLLTLFAYLLSLSIPKLSPPILQRMLMSKNPMQTRNAYWICSILALPFFVIVVLIGIAGYVIAPNHNSSNIFLYLVDNTMPIGFKGLAVSGIIAVIMSSADSFINTAAVCASHDIFKGVLGNRLSDKSELKIAKYVTLFSGLLACFIAMNFKSILDLMLYSFKLWGPVISVPLIFGIFGITVPLIGFYSSMIAGISTSFLWTIYSLEKVTFINSLLPALLANFIVFIVFVIFKNYKESNKQLKMKL